MGSYFSTPERRYSAESKGITTVKDEGIERRYQVYPSVYGPDLPKGFLNHLHDQFASKGITTFKDERIERGLTIGPEFVQAIRETRVSIVVLSPNYPSSRWCLDELVEIFKCQKASGQIVLIIYHNVAPSEIRTLGGYCGRVFEKTCEGETEQVKKRWRDAMRHVGSRRGEVSAGWFVVSFERNEFYLP